MKKIYLLASALVLGASFSLNAQLQNGGFENWTNNVLDSWGSQDALIPQLVGAGATVQIGGVDITSSITESTSDAAEGNSNVKIQSFTIGNTPSPQNIPNGVYGNYISQTIQTTDKHAGVAFAYKADIQGTDAVGVFVNATNSTNPNPIAQGYKIYTADETGWIRDTITLNYSETPEEIEILFASSFGTVISGTSAPASGVDGTVMEVDDVQLLAAPAYADPATNIVAADIADNGDGRDLEVSFDAAADESTVSEYRIIVMEEGLSLLDWSAAPSQVYTAVSPTGDANYTVTLPQTALYLEDVGNNQVGPTAIVENVAMEVYIYSVADGTNAVANQIAGPSNVITLTSGGTSSLVELSKSVKVFPNPANDFVTIQVDGLENGNVSIASITGQEVINTPISGLNKVNVSALNNGVYIYKITNANGELVKTSKLVIQK